MLDDNKPDFDLRRERAGGLDPYAPDLSGRGVLDVLRQKQSDSELAGAHEVRDPRVWRLSPCGRPARGDDRK